VKEKVSSAMTRRVGICGVCEYEKIVYKSKKKMIPLKKRGNKSPL
jgi:hypothetical protein